MIRLTTTYMGLISLLFLSLSCKDKAPAASGPVEKPGLIAVSQAQFTQMQMELGTVQTMLLPETVRANGMIDVPPENRAVISPLIGGYVSQAPLLIGDEVRKNQLLLQLKSPEYIQLQQDYLEVFQGLTALENDYQRQKLLHEEEISSRKQLLAAESAYKAAQARSAGLRNQLQLLRVDMGRLESGQINPTLGLYAPIAGSITQVNTSVGTYVAPASEVMEIVNNDHLHLELMVLEQDILKIAIDQHIRFQIPEVSPDHFKAEVYLIGKSLDANRMVKVHAHLEDEDKVNFITGMYVTAEIAVSEVEGAALPESAILESESQFSVLALDHKEGETYYFKALTVTPGNSANGYTQVESSELTPESQVLIKGGFNLLGY